MNERPDGFLERLYRDSPPEYSFKAENAEEWKQWRQDLRQAFLGDLGIGKEDKPALDPQLLEETACEGYTRQRVSFTTFTGLDMLAYVLIPSDGRLKHPAVVACHGHGYGSREIVGLLPDGTETQGDPGYQKNFALSLVDKGFLVIVPEILGFGDRRLAEDRNKPLGSSSCDRVSSFLLMMGRTMAGMRVAETMRTIDYLESRKDVDGTRIGCMGISGGGLVCSFTAAVDDRIKAAVVSGYANTFHDSVMAMEHCIDNFVPGLVRHAELPDILSLIAPRPLLMESGTEDPIFPIQAFHLAHERIRKAYALLDAEDRVDVDVFIGDHQIGGEKAFPFLVDWLR
jgi:dienelactone hydrolase